MCSSLTLHMFLKVEMLIPGTIRCITDPLVYHFSNNVNKEGQPHSLHEAVYRFGVVHISLRHR